MYQSSSFVYCLNKSRRYPGRPRINEEIEQLVVRMAKENSDWGYDRIVGAMGNLGYRLSNPKFPLKIGLKSV